MELEIKEWVQLILELEIKEWIQLIFIVVGGTIGLATYRQNLKQRRIENALKVISIFKEALQDGDIDAWRDLFHSASEPAGAERGHFKNGNMQLPISYYFSEGAPDGGAVARMAKSLEFVCFEANRKNIDIRYIWFELGQLLKTMHSWLSAIEHLDGNLIEEFPSIKKTFLKHEKKFKKWPLRIYAYVE